MARSNQHNPTYQTNPSEATQPDPMAEDDQKQPRKAVSRPRQHSTEVDNPIIPQDTRDESNQNPDEWIDTLCERAKQLLTIAENDGKNNTDYFPKPFEYFPHELKSTIKKRIEIKVLRGRISEWKHFALDEHLDDEIKDLAGDYYLERVKTLQFQLEKLERDSL